MYKITKIKYHFYLTNKNYIKYIFTLKIYFIYVFRIVVNFQIYIFYIHYMKKNILLLLFILLTFSQNIIAQNNQSRLKLGLSVGLNLTSPMSQNDNLSPYLTKSFLGYSFGAEVRYQLRNRFILHTGLYFTHKSYQMPTTVVIYTDMQTPSEHKAIVKDEFNDIELPIILRYQLSKKYLIDVGVGAVLGFAQRSRQNLIVQQLPMYNFSFNPDAGVKSPQRINFHVSASYTHSFNNKYYVGIEPYYQFDLNAIILDTGYEHISYGVRTFFLMPVKLRNKNAKK